MEVWNVLIWRPRPAVAGKRPPPRPPCCDAYIHKFPSLFWRNTTLFSSKLEGYETFRFESPRSAGLTCVSSLIDRPSLSLSLHHLCFSLSSSHLFSIFWPAPPAFSLPVHAAHSRFLSATPEPKVTAALQCFTVNISRPCCSISLQAKPHCLDTGRCANLCPLLSLSVNLGGPFETFYICLCFLNSGGTDGLREGTSTVVEKLCCRAKWGQVDELLVKL